MGKHFALLFLSFVKNTESTSSAFNRASSASASALSLASSSKAACSAASFALSSSSYNNGAVKNSEIRHFFISLYDEKAVENGSKYCVKVRFEDRNL